MSKSGKAVTCACPDIQIPWWKIIIIYSGFVKSNFDFYPLVWNFCGKVNSGKIEKVQERALWIIYQDYDATYSDLLQAANTPSLTVWTICMLLYETFNSVCNINSKCLSDMFVTKETSHTLRKNRNSYSTEKTDNHLWPQVRILPWF